MKEIVLFVTLAFNLMAQPKGGVLDSLETELDGHNKSYQALLKASEERQIYTSTLSPNEKLVVSPLFIQSVLLYSKKQYLNLLKKSECTFYSLLENGLLRTMTGVARKVPITHNDKQLIIPAEDLVRHTYKSKCLKSKDVAQLFTPKNFFDTVRSTKLRVPKDEEECNRVHKGWINNPYLPYLCRIPETLSEAQKGSSAFFAAANRVKKELSFFSRTYLYNLCQNIDNREGFCSLYTSDDVWRKVINGERPKYLQTYKCKELFPTKKIDEDGLNQCRSILLESPHVCETSKKRSHLALIPKPNCNDISTALRSGHLKTDYHDCPASITNEAITNVHRILMHLKPHPIRSDASNCASETNFSFAKLSIDYEHQDAWPLEICYNNPINGKKKCIQYIPGDHPDSLLSETRIVAQILEKISDAPPGLTCSTVDAREFNPALLTFRNGCFIVFNPTGCKEKKCGKKIYFKNKIVKKISYRGEPTFDYFATTYKNEKVSFVSMLLKLHKVRSKPLYNLTEIESHLSKKDRIIHGVGCSEDIYPRFFKKDYFNQCTPLPFIVDGLIRENGRIYLSTRTAIDDLHSPRKTLWARIYTSVANYKEFQPLERWTLHGLR